MTFFHQVVARALREHDVDTVFGVLGDANLFIMNSFAEAGGTYLGTAGEAGAVLAAAGYASATGKLGVCTVTHGPALTNIVTALAETSRERVPIVVLAGDTAVEDPLNFQAIDQREVVATTGAGFEQVRSVKTVCQDVANAVRRAHAERRPIVLNVPVDFQWQEAEYQPAKVSVLPSPARFAPPVEALDDALGMLASARRPLLLAGRGASSPEARAAMIALAEQLGAHVATTLRGRGLFAGHEYDLGICGTLSDEYAAEVISRADCVVAFGAGLNKWTTVDGGLVNSENVIHVDTDLTALGRFLPARVLVPGDAQTVAELLLEQLTEAEIGHTGFAKPRPADATPASGEAPETAPGTVDIVSAVRALDDLLASVGAPSARVPPHHQLRLDRVGRRHRPRRCGRF